MAFLAYVHRATRFRDMPTDPYYVGILASPKEKAAFEESQRMLVEDVETARPHGPDSIIALPHMGTQFSHEPDSFSETSARAMIAEGVAEVLVCHSHAAQPTQFLSVTSSDGKRRNGFVLCCPD
ncbi:MAG TPA: hypothetical protein DD670_21185 [Planctomycetaceae bacterium]|nr:hypothetical protein [Planctomycetaceae bacterium]